jgi:hypothetical protein
MYSANGLALDNPTFGWSLRGPSKPLVPVSVQAVALSLPGRDGVVGGLRAPLEPPTLVLMVQTPRANLETLYALFRAPSVRIALTANPSKVLDCELLSITPDGYGDADAIVDVTAVLRAPGVFWRDLSDTTAAATALSTATVEANFLTGLSAPVRDAIIRVRGGVTGLNVLDSGGSSFGYAPNVPSGQWLRFHTDTGRAFTTTTDTWTGGTEVTGALTNGPGPYTFEMVPWFPLQPSQRAARLAITTTVRSGTPTIEVRGRRAFLV